MTQTFLYPTSTQYPCDSFCAQVVEVLKKRDFNIEGVTVSLSTYSNKQAFYQMVEEIEIPALDTFLKFGRPQGMLDRNRYNTAAISELAIPGKLLNVYDDYSGPTLCVYVGKNWEKDKEDFFHSFHVNSKLRGKPRTYLKYTGSTNSVRYSSYQNRLNPYLVHDNDLGREYGPEGDEPDSYTTEEIMQEFNAYLLNKVNPFLLRQPAGKIQYESQVSIGTPWAGHATQENRETLARTIYELLSERPYTFYRDLDREGDQREFHGMSTHHGRYGGSISISDSYGSWGFETNGKAWVELKDKGMVIEHTAPAGNPLHWEIVY